MRIKPLERAERRDRTYRLAGDRGDQLEVPVVVENGDLGSLGGSRDEQVRQLDGPVMERSELGEMEEDLLGPGPFAGADAKNVSYMDGSSTYLMPEPSRVAAKARSHSLSGTISVTSAFKTTRWSPINSSARRHERGVEALPLVTVSSR